MKKNNTKEIETVEVKTNNTYTIENNVPIPEKTMSVRKKGQFRSTIEKLNIGDSFVVPSLPKSYYSVQKLTGVKLVRKQNEDGTFRVWRKV